jgi:hypothetical chaperone protein
MNTSVSITGIDIAPTNAMTYGIAASSAYITISSVNVQDIDLVCCTGGTAYVPAINEGILARFGKDKLRQHQNFHSVVKGLALKAQEVVRGK